MYQWLSNVLKKEYIFVKCLKNDDKSKVIVYKHNKNNKKIVVRYIKTGEDVYEKLLKIKSDYLPQIYDVVRGESDTMVLEEYISGMTLGDVLESGLYTETGTKMVIASVCEGLEILHNNSIIHRDIKPDNIMVTDDGQIKIIDFNASKEYKEEKKEDTIILGTTGYAAPEQYGISQSDQRTDIYAVGVLINVMLTGEHPSKTLCTGRMRKIVKKAVNINPADRYQSCSELKEAIIKI